MQKNWYVVYTKPKNEKKVSNSLTRRKIENFCPQNRKQIKHIRKSKMVFEPLFSSYVFVHVEREQLHAIQAIDHVLSLVYWKGSPAIVKNEEIEIIRKFISDHEDVKLEKSKVDVLGAPGMIDRPAYSLDGNVLTLKNTAVKVNLPSIGYTLIAEFAEEKVLGREIKFIDKELLLQ